MQVTMLAQVAQVFISEMAPWLLNAKTLAEAEGTDF